MEPGTSSPPAPPRRDTGTGAALRWWALRWSAVRWSLLLTIASFGAMELFTGLAGGGEPSLRRAIVLLVAWPILEHCTRPRSAGWP